MAVLCLVSPGDVSFFDDHAFMRSNSRHTAQLGSFPWPLGLGAGGCSAALASLEAHVARKLSGGHRCTAPSPQHVTQRRVGGSSGLEMIPGFNPSLLLNHFGSKLYLHVIITLKSHYSRHLVLAITFKVAKQFP